MNYCIVTTINKPSKAIEKLHDIFGSKLVIAADRKTDVDWGYKDSTVLKYDAEKVNHYDYYCPENHYARKNIGYLYAIRNGAELIYDTDDDNIPNDNWKLRQPGLYIRGVTDKGWINAYSYFTNKFIWPRGFALRHIRNKATILYNGARNETSYIQQGLADLEPDVDAIYRIAFKNEAIEFKELKSIYLKRFAWCPFNSQSTWWFKEAFPLLYLPAYASFRMTDIWRSFVAQRCLWEIGSGVSFHSPAEVYQERNEHDILKDFEDEVDGYLHNEAIVNILQELRLKHGVENIAANMVTCYQALVDNNYLPEMEIRALNAWINDVKGNS